MTREEKVELMYDFCHAQSKCADCNVCKNGGQPYIFCRVYNYRDMSEDQLNECLAAAGVNLDDESEETENEKPVSAWNLIRDMNDDDYSDFIAFAKVSDLSDLIYEYSDEELIEKYNEFVDRRIYKVGDVVQPFGIAQEYVIMGILPEMDGFRKIACMKVYTDEYYDDYYAKGEQTELFIFKEDDVCRVASNIGSVKIVF